jgi:hypothetical protein
MSIKRLWFVVFAILPLSAFAHHSVSYNFSEEILELEGTITSVKWVNPHGSFLLKVPLEDGTTQEWLIEMLAKIALQRQNFDFDALQNGTKIKLTGRRSHRGHTMRFGEATLPDGRVIKERIPSALPSTP